MKRALDVVMAVAGLLLAAPVLLLFMLLIWLQDGHSPLYRSRRVGLGGRPFAMVKLRSMIVGAERSQVLSTAGDDPRITRIGSLVRRYKLDELTQLWNVLVGSMTMVGPRPQNERDVRLYTAAERRLLTAAPGITDFASIVFADESDILAGAADPDLRYQQVVRPWKSRLGLFYVDHASRALDLALIGLTVVALVDRRAALLGVGRALTRLGASRELVRVAQRDLDLVPYPPPGARRVAASR